MSENKGFDFKTRIKLETIDVCVVCSSQIFIYLFISATFTGSTAVTSLYSHYFHQQWLCINHLSHNHKVLHLDTESQILLFPIKINVLCWCDIGNSNGVLKILLRLTNITFII